MIERSGITQLFLRQATAASGQIADSDRAENVQTPYKKPRGKDLTPQQKGEGLGDSLRRTAVRPYKKKAK